MSTPELFTELLRAALPSLRSKPAARMPKRLYGYVWRISKRQQIRLCLLTLLIFPLSLAPLELQRRMINDGVGGRDLQLLLVLGALYLAVVLGHGGLKYLRNLYQNWVSEGVIRLLRLRIVEAGFPSSTDEGTKQSIISHESERIGQFVGESLSFPLMQAGIMLSVAGYMLVVQPLIAAVAIAFFAPPLIVVPLLQRVVNRLAGERTRLARALGETVIEEARQAGTGTAPAGYGDAGAEADGDAARLIGRIYRLRLRIFLLKYFLKFFSNLFGQLGPLGVLLVGGWLALRGETTIGAIVAFISGYERLTNPGRDLLNFYRRMSEMRVQYRLVRDAAMASAS